MSVGDFFGYIIGVTVVLFVAAMIIIMVHGYGSSKQEKGDSGS